MQEVAYLWARLWVSCHSVPPCWMLYGWASLLRITHVLLSVFTLSSAYYSLLEYKVHVFPLQQRAWVDIELTLHLHSCCPVKAVCVWVVVSAHTICSVINCDTFWPRQLFLLSYISLMWMHSHGCAGVFMVWLGRICVFGSIFGVLC